ncbi:MAG: hypothetical protein RL033_3332 [Pseudomonadota bacterium]
MLAAEGDAEAEAAPSEPPSEVTLKLDQAMKEIGQLNYTEGQQILLGVIQSGKANAEQLSKAYFGIGEVEAALGNEVESTDSFYLALMIQPSTLFPAGGSPKIRERVNAARSRVTEVGALEAKAGIDGGVLQIQLRNDPLKLVKAIEVSMTKASGDVGKATLEPKAQRVEVESDVSAIRVILHDESGNELKAIDVDVAAKGGASPASVAKPLIWERWGLWAGVAGAFALGGTYFMMESGKLADDINVARGGEEPNLPRANNLEDRRDRVGIYSAVGFSLAGAAAVTAGALLLFHDDPAAAAKEDAPTEAHLVPQIGPGHVGAELSLRF